MAFEDFASEWFLCARVCRWSYLLEKSDTVMTTACTAKTEQEQSPHAREWQRVWFIKIAWRKNTTT